ncbi:IclR family transcriptional regulator domain-containing protein [Brucella endophytica]|nr:IclR family transcriptional regulator C-terminal domain-containing protein [Brucella endophytica]
MKRLSFSSTIAAMSDVTAMAGMICLPGCALEIQELRWQAEKCLGAISLLCRLLKGAARLPGAPVQDQLIPTEIKKFTARTIADRAKLKAELQRIREAGYCVSRGEVSEQLVSVAVPVLAFDGSVIASVNIAAPAFRTSDNDVQRYVLLLKEAAKKISDGLGW